MQVQFGEILTGRGRRTGKPQDQRVIERRAIGIFERSEGGLARFGQTPRERLQRRTSPRSAHTHDADRRRRHPARQRKNRFGYTGFVPLLSSFEGFSLSVAIVATAV